MGPVFTESQNPGAAEGTKETRISLQLKDEQTRTRVADRLAQGQKEMQQKDIRARMKLQSQYFHFFALGSLIGGSLGSKLLEDIHLLTHSRIHPPTHLFIHSSIHLPVHALTCLSTLAPDIFLW